jgi:hypothetical protein
VTPVGWIALAIVGLAFVLVLVAIRADRNDWADLSADLDDTNSDLDDVKRDLSYVLDHLHGTSSGRHAATTEIQLSKEPT